MNPSKGFGPAKTKTFLRLGHCSILNAPCAVLDLCSSFTLDFCSGSLCGLLSNIGRIEETGHELKLWSEQHHIFFKLVDGCHVLSNKGIVTELFCTVSSRMNSVSLACNGKGIYFCTPRLYY